MNMENEMTELAQFRYHRDWEAKIAEKMKEMGFTAKAEFYRACVRKALFGD
jgi:hypothetical protein